MERELETTYKTAWRILTLIRKALAQKDTSDGGKLYGDVEMDGAYIGGRHDSGTYNKRQKEAIAAKSLVLGAVERGGRARVSVVPDMSADTHGWFLEANVDSGARLLTDKTNRLDRVAAGYDRHVVNHNIKEYVRGDVHTNTIDGFWAHVKRSIKGTHKVVSKKHLQEYLDGFVFHYNNRHSDKVRFGVLLGKVMLGAG